MAVCLGLRWVCIEGSIVLRCGTVLDGIGFGAGGVP